MSGGDGLRWSAPPHLPTGELGVLCALIFAGCGSGVALGPHSKQVSNSCDSSVDVYYHGNGAPVIGEVQVTTLFWGDAVADLRAAINTFLVDVTNSAYLDSLAEYSTTGQSIGRGAVVGSQDFSPTDSLAGATQIADSDIQYELAALVADGTLSAGPAQVVMVFMPAEATITDPSDQGTSRTSFYGYHNSIDLPQGPLYYAVIPDPSAGAITHGFAQVLDFVTVVASHELAEAITDPATNNGAWYDDVLSEIGDICAWKYPPVMVAGHQVQRVWSQARGACMATPGPLDLTVCDGACADLQNDPLNCGGCQTPCGPSTPACVQGQCQ